MMKAKVEEEYLNVLQYGMLGGEMVVEVPCRDYDHYKTLPAAITFEGYLCGKTGWSSDNGYACYKSGVKLAKKNSR